MQADNARLNHALSAATSRASLLEQLVSDYKDALEALEAQDIASEVDIGQLRQDLLEHEARMAA